MKCDNCEKNNGVFNMNNVCCIARHVLMIYMPKHQRLDYMVKLADKYKVSLDSLKAEVTRQFNESKQ